MVQMRAALRTRERTVGEATATIRIAEDNDERPRVLGADGAFDVAGASEDGGTGHRDGAGGVVDAAPRREVRRQRSGDRSWICQGTRPRTALAAHEKRRAGIRVPNP